MQPPQAPTQNQDLPEYQVLYSLLTKFSILDNQDWQPAYWSLTTSIIAGNQEYAFPHSDSLKQFYSQEKRNDLQHLLLSLPHPSLSPYKLNPTYSTNPTYSVNKEAEQQVTLNP